MTITVRNTSDSRRVWPSLCDVEGHVLVLDPGEEKELSGHPGTVAHLAVQHKKPKSVVPEDSTGGK